MNLQDFANGADINECLKPKGLCVDRITQGLVNQGARNIRFLLSMGFLTQEEAQTAFNRIIALIGRNIKEA